MKLSLNTLFILILIPCLFWQYQNTKVQPLWVQTPAEYDLQYHNINLYPASLLRIGNQLENKKYFQLFFKSLNRFYYPLNLNLLFSNWRLIFLPLFLFGFSKIKKGDLSTLFVLLFFPLLLVNIIGYINQAMYAFYPLIIWLNLKCFLKK